MLDVSRLGPIIASVITAGLNGNIPSLQIVLHNKCQFCTYNLFSKPKSVDPLAKSYLAKYSSNKESHKICYLFLSICFPLARYYSGCMFLRIYSSTVFLF